MAIFFANLQIVSRADGRSSTGAAAYRSGTLIRDERTGAVHDYRRKRGVVYSTVLLPSVAPERFASRSVLWNELEAAERRGNAQLAREFLFALPVELDREQQTALCLRFASSLTAMGMCVDLAIHDVDGSNPHVHMLCPTRPVGPDGFTAKSVAVYAVRDADGNAAELTADEIAEEAGRGHEWERTYHYRRGRERRDMTASEAEADGGGWTRKGSAIHTSRSLVAEWNDRARCEEWRALWAKYTNEALERAHRPERVDHRSYERRGIARVPQLKEGPAVTAVERKAEREAREAGVPYEPLTEVRRENVEAAKTNRLIEALQRQLGQVRAALARFAGRAREALAQIAGFEAEKKARERGGWTHEHSTGHSHRGRSQRPRAAGTDYEGPSAPSPAPSGRKSHEPRL